MAARAAEGTMRRPARLALTCLLAAAAPAPGETLTPTGTLRAVYLAGNPAQAVRDPETGAIRGVAADLARELAKRLGVPVDIAPAASPQAVIDRVAGAAADIGFVAFAPSRTGTVEFSQTYMHVQQSFLVRAESPIRAIADIDRAGRKIAGSRNDSITLYMQRKFTQAAVVEIDPSPAEIGRLFAAGEIDAFGANRQRLTTLMGDMAGLRLLPGSLFGVPQTIVLGKGKADALATVNRFLDEMRASGFIARAIGASGIVGLDVAPGGSWQPRVPD
ncbi:MAG: transporter substrate-binding domain-containing protein [Alphaproteobacteria bacterium]